MIGSLPLPRALVTSPVIPRRGPAPLRTVIVAGKPTKLGMVPRPPIEARAILPTELVRVPVRPPMPSLRPIVQAGRPIPALQPSAPLTSLAPPFYAAPAAGLSVVSIEPPGDARLPAPLPFGSAMSTLDPIFPENFGELDPVFPDYGPELEAEPTPASSGAAVPVYPSTVAAAKTSSHAVIVGALVGVALLGGVGAALYARRKR
ncbi:MAG TPA: hypothetical protein VM925_21790 [Labilithrix sp.]|nr:hypothetical protein [Labilithrix sp.]